MQKSNFSTKEDIIKAIEENNTIDLWKAIIDIFEGN